MATELSLKRGFMNSMARPRFGTPVKGVTITGGAGGGPIAPMRPPVRNDGMVQTSGMYGRGGGSVGQNNMYRRGGPRMGGNMNVTEAINAGHTVMPWAPSSGVGPASRGYRGSGGRAEGFHTGRPSASNSSEYYANRDRAIGNPLEMLKLNGPGRGGDLMQSLIAESRGGGTQNGTDAYYAAKGLGPDGKPLASPTGFVGPSNVVDGGIDDLGSATMIQDVAPPEGLALGDSVAGTPQDKGTGLYSQYGTGFSAFAKPKPALASTGAAPRAVSPVGTGVGFTAVGTNPEEGFEPVTQSTQQQGAWYGPPRVGNKSYFRPATMEKRTPLQKAGNFIKNYPANFKSAIHDNVIKPAARAYDWFKRPA